MTYIPALNAALVQECISKGGLPTKKKLLDFVSAWIARFTKQTKTKLLKNKQESAGEKYKPLGRDIVMYIYEPENIQLLYNILNFEIECMFDPKIDHLYITYRGSRSGPDGDIILLRNEPEHSLSLSNGILEGNINDCQACAFNYMLLDDKDMKSGYALLFDKDLDANVIKIPPLTSLARSLGYGTHFHPRNNPEQNKNAMRKTLIKNTAFISDRRMSEIKFEPFVDGTSLASYLKSKQSLSILSNNRVKNKENASTPKILVFLVFLAMVLGTYKWFSFTNKPKKSNKHKR